MHVIQVDGANDSDSDEEDDEDDDDEDDEGKDKSKDELEEDPYEVSWVKSYGRLRPQRCTVAIGLVRCISIHTWLRGVLVKLEYYRYFV